MITLKINMTTNQNNYSQTLDSLMCEIRTEDIYEDFSSNKKCFIFVIIQISQNTMTIQTN